jgi:protein translocase SecG subunit
VSVLSLIVFFLVAFLIVGLVLLQEGKGGGLTGMSTGMDGVMGAKNPLRRMTAYLFVIFVLLAIGINYYFHHRRDDAIPQGMDIPSAQRELEEQAPFTGPLVVPSADGDVEAVPAPPAPIDSTPEASAESPAESAPVVESSAASTADDATPSLPVPPEAYGDASGSVGESAPPAPIDIPAAETIENAAASARATVEEAAAVVEEKVDAAAERVASAAAEAGESAVETVDGAGDAGRDAAEALREATTPDSGTEAPAEK